MNILFICGNVNPNSSQGVRYKNLLPIWCKDHNITLLAYYPLTIEGVQQQVNLYQPSAKINSNKKNYFKTLIKKVYKQVFRQFIFPDRYKYALPAYKNKIAALLSSNKYDSVVIAMTPYSLYMLADFIKKTDNSLKILIDLSDPFIDNASNKGKILFNNKHIKRYESKFLKYTDSLIVLNPTIQQIYANTYHLKNRVHVIEQGFSNLPINAVNDQNSRKNQLLIYAGGLNKTFRNPFPLYKAIKQTNNKWLLDLYGIISEELLPSNNSNITYYGLTSYSSLIEKYGLADIIVFIDNAFGYQVPGKLLEVISTGKPILFIYSNPKSPSFYYIADTPQVITVVNKQEEITAKLNEIRELDIRFDGMEKLKQYEWSNLANKYLSLMHE